MRDSLGFSFNEYELFWNDAPLGEKSYVDSPRLSGCVNSELNWPRLPYGCREGTSDFELQTLDFIEDYFINCCEIILLIKV